MGGYTLETAAQYIVTVSTIIIIIIFIQIVTLELYKQYIVTNIILASARGHHSTMTTSTR